MARGSIQELMLLVLAVNAIMLCDQDHRDLIKEAVEHEVYACILAPYEEWEVLTMIRNIIAKKKLKERKKLNKDQAL